MSADKHSHTGIPWDRGENDVRKEDCASWRRAEEGEERRRNNERSGRKYEERKEGNGFSDNFNVSDNFNFYTYVDQLYQIQLQQTLQRMAH